MRYKLLIVDDERGIVDMMRSYFEPQYEVLAACSGGEALEKIRLGPDLILLDITMPQMDGMTVCRKIREYVSCPILFLTARVEASDKIAGFRAGADDYIVKPFDLDELGARVAAHLRREQRRQDLAFVIPEVSGDEMGQLCAAFEDMRRELLRTNQELWRQGEERRRLNAAFAHNLRNPVTVLKGTVKQLRQGGEEEQAWERMETYTMRIEQYVEAMSRIQRLEQMPVRRKPLCSAILQKELEETAKVLVPPSGPSVRVAVSVQEPGETRLDHGIFLTVAENLIGNAARFAKEEVRISLKKEGGILTLTVRDDGPGFPAWLVKSGPKPFGKTDGSAEHFGMGLYSSQVLCMKHGGELKVENGTGAQRGAVVKATFV